ncbi:polyamine aminopropyltransferase [Candidatus Desulforudis audaxviator]|uniref:Polyamine aminopropyltransferase n=1 Tax=Desulforudis audaxviator (strain MP104C) TaxID=477974 RepID=SPEE_DESAP|nr:polyamine aminopropyltransferase [Candidatus Desulforudis audaxviator]B1I5Z0.1 RecName: Full=Polyamine aminopropyltransferase; AltName: Full=Putrescine aminopropyltransferase; Short=PAPT; AltName: Full=Spermidine synthase; Short=SPDS; Short=SPDSY [Candidatus Desulforudis audaxviator MP104C]ACA60470.1 spermidine synthase [Candidatus Desulforudis audaxviator MP104C]AZK60540.1 Spermidine synthase [Candidatus Desulforudis audaxviator]
MHLWFTEKQNDNFAISYRVNETLHTETTPFQHLAVLDTVPFGRTLVLDGIVQTSVVDEYVYHEMITHVPLNTHPDPRRVLIVGGGDGGTLREVTKHPSVEKATLVEIDERVIAASKKYLPELACGFDSPKAEVVIGDGIKYVAEHKKTFDLVIVDSTDPIGPAVGLFSLEFYRSIYEALKDEGLFVAQTESPYFNTDLILRIYRDIAGIFPLARTYWACIPTYPGAMWSFTIGSKKHDPAQVAPEKIREHATRYYTPEIHRASFAMPRFLADRFR